MNERSAAMEHTPGNEPPVQPSDGPARKVHVAATASSISKAHGSRWIMYSGLAVLSIMILELATRGHAVGAVALVIVTIVWVNLMPYVIGHHDGRIFQQWQLHYRQRPILLGLPKSKAAQWMVLAAWIIGFVALGTALWHAPNPQDSVDAGFITLFFMVSGAGVPWYGAELMLYRRWGATPKAAAFHAVMAVGAGLGLVLSTLALEFAQALIGPEPVHPWAPYFPIAMALALFSGAAVRYRLTMHWQQRLDAEVRRADLAEQAQQLAEMRLALLQAQIEPHFLYNTLASVQYLVRKEPAIAEFLLTQLIRYLRQSMPTMRAQTSTLGREFELADAYLQIARVRMGARLDVGVELEERLHAIPFPPLMVQTLVENAIKHGIEPKAGQVRIDVTAQRDGDRLIVAVIDNGVGLGGAPTAGGGTGLRNLRQRLAALYGDAAELQVASRNGSHHAAGVVSRLIVPLTPQDAPAGPATTDLTRSD